MSTVTVLQQREQLSTDHISHPYPLTSHLYLIVNLSKEMEGLFDLS